MPTEDGNFCECSFSFIPFLGTPCNLSRESFFLNIFSRWYIDLEHFLNTRCCNNKWSCIITSSTVYTIWQPPKRIIISLRHWWYLEWLCTFLAVCSSVGLLCVGWTVTHKPYSHVGQMMFCGRNVQYFAKVRQCNSVHKSEATVKWKITNKASVKLLNAHLTTETLSPNLERVSITSTQVIESVIPMWRYYLWFNLMFIPTGEMW